MKVLVIGSLVVLAATVAWSLVPWEASEGVVDKPRGAHANTGNHRRFEDLPELAEREEAVEPGEAAEQAPTEDLEPGADEDLVTVRGRVVTVSGEETENIRIVMQGEGRPCTPGDTDSSDCGPPLFSTVADSETGDFELQAPPGSYTIVARAQGLLPAGARGLQLSHGESVEGLMLTLTEGSRIRGLVYNDGAPQESVRVVANGEGFTRSALTDEEGRFEIPGLPDGEFTVRAYATFAGGDEKTVRSGGSVNLDLGHRERVRGRVVDARGFPAEGVSISSDFVVVHDEASADPWPVENDPYEEGMDSHGCGPSPDCYARAVTGADGRFELETSPGEQLMIAATRGDERALAEEVSYERRDDVVLTLEAPHRLKLVDVEGRAVKATVTVGNSSQFWLNTLESDENGDLVLPAHAGLLLNVPPGTHLDGEVPEDTAVQEEVDGIGEPPERMPDDLELNPPPPQAAPVADAVIIY